jgi:hypothetical protein
MNIFSISPPPNRRIELAPRTRFDSFTTVNFLRIGCLIAFGLLPAAALHGATVSAQVFSVAGSVEFAGPGSSSFAPLKKGQLLPIGSTVRTGDDGVAVLVTTPGSAVQLGNSSILKINKLAFAKSGSDVTQRSAVLQLTSGVVSALIDPSTPKITDFQVETPEGAAAARGTFYAVLVYHGKTYVGVKEGHVGLTASGQ